jgi:zinc/manganese transport system substrate-binding protein
MCAIACFLAAAAAAASLGACGRTGPGPAAGGLRVVAAESFWGSLAAQLAGSRLHVESIIVNPRVDPHSYQPSARDARAIAGAGMVIVNGLGYDDWASQLLRSSPQGGRVVLDVGRLLHLPGGSNPHRWYYPADVHAVIAAIAAGYERLDPRGAAYYAEQRRRLEAQGLASYDRLLGEIRSRYAGVPVGYSESIFQGLGEYLGLRLLTPYGYAKAIAEGTDVSAQDKQTVDAQARERKIAVWLFNGQNVTPDVQRVNALAREASIPVVTITETPSPAGASFQRWQSAELEALLAALRRATGS